MLEPPDLSSSWIRIRLLQESDLQALSDAAVDPDVWRWFTADLSDPSRMKNWVQNVLAKRRAGIMIPLVVEDIRKELIVGSSSFMNIAEEDLCLEIGTTWIRKEYHGSGINYHMKFLMLRHAFEVWNFERVELRTDALNVRSRRAIEKIGASYDGLFKNHRFNKNGGRRDSVIYSIVKQDWPEIKSKVFGEIQ